MRIRELTAACCLAGMAMTHLPATAQSGWQTRLHAGLAAIDPGENSPPPGVYVRDLASGESASFHGDENWYLASTVKVPIAIAVLRAVEQKRLSLDTLVTLRSGDYVDGSGSTNRLPAGSVLQVRKLMEQMIIHSDNTASDLLIDQVGIGRVNAVVAELVPHAGFGPVTSLADVRRAVYGGLSPAAEKLSGGDWLRLNALPDDTARLKLFSSLTGVAPSAFHHGSLDAAYDAYYASGANSARLDAYADLLAALVGGRAVGPESTHYLLGLMGRIATGRQRVGAGLPPGTAFAHKTGTQRRRICDSGIVSTGGKRGQPLQQVLLVSCVRDAPSLKRAENTLMQVGQALCRSGLITQGIPDAPTCHTAPGTSRRAPAAAAPVAVPGR